VRGRLGHAGYAEEGSDNRRGERELANHVLS
jgi:hypothetical protein